MTPHAHQLKSERAYRIEPYDTPQIGALVDMLVYTRLTTLAAVQSLTTEQLDAVPADCKNSIGMLLAHIVAVHRIYHGLSFEGRDVSQDASFKAYLGALTMGENGPTTKGHPLDWYVAQLELAQTVTLAGLAARDDDWLNSRMTAPDMTYANHHWAWFHVIEDEINHRGQIRLLRRLVAPITDRL